jgi:hypothetical protein
MARLFAPEDEAAAVGELARRYAPSLQGEHFELGGRHEPGLVELKAALVRDDGTFRYEIEARADLGDRQTGLTPAEGRELVLDFLGFYLDLYFEGGRDTLLPLDFQPYEVGNRVVYARGDTLNPLLDSLADRILAAGVPLADDDPLRKLRLPK